MKKTYFTPQIMVVKLPISKILAGSPNLEWDESGQQGSLNPDEIE